jgi:hypothetical protein
MKTIFEDDEDVAVMEPPCITKKGKTVYVNDILGVVGIKGIRSVRSEIQD